MATRWTEEEDQLLLKLRSEGFTTNEMVYHLAGRSAAAIRTRMTKIASDNLNRRWTEEEKQRALTMKDEGKSNKYIAKALDRTPRAIAAFIIRYWDSVSSKTSLEKEL